MENLKIKNILNFIGLIIIAVMFYGIYYYQIVNESVWYTELSKSTNSWYTVNYMIREALMNG